MCHRSTAVEHSTHNPRIEGLNPYWHLDRENACPIYINCVLIAQWYNTRLIILRLRVRILTGTLIEKICHSVKFNIHWVCHGSTAVEHSTRNPKIEGLNPYWHLDRENVCPIYIHCAPVAQWYNTWLIIPRFTVWSATCTCIEKIVILLSLIYIQCATIAQL